MDQLIGDPSKARKVLGWAPKYTFEELVREMVQSDLEAEARTMGRDRPQLVEYV